VTTIPDRPPLPAAVTFDLWETVITDPPERLRARDALRIEAVCAALDAAGHATTGAAVAGAIAVLDRRCAAIRATEADFGIRTQVGFLLEALDPELPGRLDPGHVSALVDAYTGPILRHPPLPMPGVSEALSALRSAGVPVALISNTGRTPGGTLRRVLDGHGLLGWFDVLTFSDEHELCKPAPAIFHRTLGALGVPAAHAWHIGDQPVLDVLGANRAGMRSVLFARRPPAASPHVPAATVASMSEFVELLGLGHGAAS
jgi:putative hydrolase of the HAD superfamily